MVAAVRRGESQRSVARAFYVSLRQVQYWIKRTQGQSLEEVDWTDRPPIPTRPRRTSLEIEDLVLQVRDELRESLLGEYGPEAILRELCGRGTISLPSRRTIARILERRGALDQRRRIRHPAPPRGWYLPTVAARRAELDSFDVVEGLVIRGGTEIQVFTGVSLLGGLLCACPRLSVTAVTTVEDLIAHWRTFGLPGYAQFDNDTRFQGAHQHRDSIGRVIRLCLSLGVVPVFAPPREHGFQAGVESFNGRWQAKVWSRYEHRDLFALQEISASFLAEHRNRTAARRESAPARQAFPKGWSFDLQLKPQGCLIYLRRTSETGDISVLGHRFHISPRWPHRLVRAEVHLDLQTIRFYALRRRDPAQQPLLKEIDYTLPYRTFHE